MLAYLLNKYWVNKKSFVTVTGKPTQARKLIDEPHIKWPLFAVCLVVAAVIILFYGTVVFGSFVKTWGYDYTLTLDQYTRALQQGWDSLRNSIILGLIGALIGGLLGVILGGAGVYDKLVDFAGAGATVPLTGFGNTLAKGVREAVKEQGILGALTGGLKASAAGIAAAVFFGFLAALLCNPKDKS